MILDESLRTDVDNMFVFSADLYDDIDLQMEEYGLICECLGGGRIFHDAKRQIIEVFGRSQVYFSFENYWNQIVLSFRNLMAQFLKIF